jgi:glycerol kinase
MSDNILSIDAGTTNVIAMIVGPDGGVVGKASKRLRLLCPSPGLVEQDPEEIWSTTMAFHKGA